MRSGLIAIEQLESVDLFDLYRREALRDHPGLRGRRLLFEAIRRMLSEQVYDVIAATRERIVQSGVQTVDDVRAAPALVTFSNAMRQRSQVLKTFLLHNLYRHPQVMETTERARRVIHDLFGCYLSDPSQMPESHRRESDMPRAVADYIAGMTDRFAIREHERLFGAVLFP